MVLDTGTNQAPAYSVIDAIVYKHNVLPGSVIPVLQEIQETYGYVPPAVIPRIAENMGISISEIYGVVTFYSQFKLKPSGKNIIKVCHGTACHLKGADRIASALTQATGTREGETSEDGKFTIEKVACLGCCSLAPCVTCNNEIHGGVNPDEINKIVKSLED
jgi:NADH-quinone oxidoreductase subunit E